jgi:predicted aconitase
VFAELAHEHFCRPRPTAVSSALDDLRQAFVDKTLEVSLHAVSKAAVGAAFARVTPDKPPGQDAKAKKAAADKRKAAAASAAATSAGPKPSAGAKPATKK